MEKYILNKTPLRTTNGFKINDLEIELDIPEVGKFVEYRFSENLNAKQEVKDNFTSRIGLEHNKYLNVDIVIDKEYENNIIIDSDDNLVSIINITFKKNSNANLIFRYKSDKEVFNNVKFVINSEKNSKGNISIVNMLNKDSKNIVAIENYVNGDITINYVDLGGSLRISNYYAELNENSINNFNNMYFGKDTERIDMNYLVKLLGKNSEGNMNVQGALDDKAYKTFKGTLDFVEGAKGSVGKENENCVLLSDDIINRSLPMMLCHEEDVAGAHGVSAGKIDKSKLFYLMSRGLDEDEARRLIINANFAQVINNIPDEEIRHEILKEIEKEVG